MTSEMQNQTTDNSTSTEMTQTEFNPLKYGECSAGAQILIERMHSHPEEFAGGFAKLSRFTSHGYNMSERDQKAVQAAYGELLLEPALAEDIITALVVKEEEPAEAMRLSSSGLGISTGTYAHGFSDPRQQYGSPYQQAQQQVIKQQLAAQMTNAAMQTHPPLKLSPGVPGLSLDGEHLTGSMVKTIKQKLGIK